MILLVAIVMLFVVGAMAALSIDVVTFYTARSEAQLAADSAALAGARALANSGMTSDPSARTDGLMASAESLANTIATEVAIRNEVGGRTLLPATGEVTITFNDSDPSFATNPRITVQTRRADLPTFFARIWGSAVVTVQASATAEAYNPSGIDALGGVTAPVAPMCVKPWVLPNMSPNDASGNTPIINRATGAIFDTSLLGPPISTLLQPLCPVGACRLSTLGKPAPWNFFPGDQSSFPAPATALPSCAGSFKTYQNSIAGCVQTPIACGTTVNLVTAYRGLHQDTADAANCLTHSSNNEGDSVDQASVPTAAAYQFLTGAQNPLVQGGQLAAGTDVSVSDSIVTVPIYDSTVNVAPVAGTPVMIIGFLQLFVNNYGSAANTSGIQTQVINIAGCGTQVIGQTTQPILGNGGSPVPVRLIARP